MSNFEPIAVLELFARAGGGGSSGGSGGGGGEILALLGYVPSYYLGKLIKKLLPRKAELIVSGSFATLFTVILFFVGIHVGVVGVFYMTLVVIGIWSGWAAAFFDAWDRLKKRAEKTKKQLSLAEQSDSAWNEQRLTSYAQQLFLQFQQDWSSFNINNIISYTTPVYGKHLTLQLQILDELRRTNIITNVHIKQLLIVDMHDDVDNTRDQFTVALEASAQDQLINTESGSPLYTDTRTFTEYWQFIRDANNKWLLASISQQTQDAMSMNASLVQFARDNYMFYSLDMGWLYLPNTGVLASRGKFGASDINNHVVGTYHSRLVQLYTFTPVPDHQSPDNWLIVQLTLPKSYDGIVIQRDKQMFTLSNSYLKTPKNYQKYEFEWPDFNKRYDVHATNADRLAAFELLNPGFMSYLYDNDPGVGIEVSGNILYLFKQLGTVSKTGIDATEYEKMLTIALKAFKELQL